MNIMKKAWFLSMHTMMATFASEQVPHLSDQVIAAVVEQVGLEQRTPLCRPNPAARRLDNSPMFDADVASAFLLSPSPYVQNASMASAYCPSVTSSAVVAAGAAVSAKTHHSVGINTDGYENQHMCFLGEAAETQADESDFFVSLFKAKNGCDVQIANDKMVQVVMILKKARTVDTGHVSHNDCGNQTDEQSFLIQNALNGVLHISQSCMVEERKFNRLGTIAPFHIIHTFVVKSLDCVPVALKDVILNHDDKCVESALNTIAAYTCRDGIDSLVGSVSLDVAMTDRKQFAETALYLFNILSVLKEFEQQDEVVRCITKEFIELLQVFNNKYRIFHQENGKIALR